MAPIKLPGKALKIIKYIAPGLGVVETVLDDKDKKKEEESPPLSEGSPDKEKRYWMKGNDIRIGTLGDTLCSIWASFSLGDVLHTALMAVVGTVVSYATSRLLGRVRKK